VFVSVRMLLIWGCLRLLRVEDLLMKIATGERKLHFDSGALVLKIVEKVWMEPTECNWKGNQVKSLS